MAEDEESKPTVPWLESHKSPHLTDTFFRSLRPFSSSRDSYILCYLHTPTHNSEKLAMHFSTLRFLGFFSFTLLTMTSAIPTVEVRGTSDMTKRDVLSDGQVSRRSLELETRHPNDEFGVSRREDNTLERRQAADIAKSVGGLINSILEGVQHDNEGREKFTKDIVAKGRQQYPDFNWVVCHVKHETQFNGEKGKDWGHQHQEFDLQIGGTVGYEIYWLRSGTFKRQGDGGYINWAWSGAISGTDDNGATVHFVNPT
ncbi:hypothetical protein D9756_007348 [Leucocoprinus leucothites]|uniref:Uncharacterized protein n=1 Tax=Leucocoprinus leucothites TaxID=201217 RepID=A0A8H5D6Z1_9AGAR|nr:hypothetical protein D9756_007348 [Leucoagaricus leucothites]